MHSDPDTIAQHTDYNLQCCYVILFGAAVSIHHTCPSRTAVRKHVNITDTLFPVGVNPNDIFPYRQEAMTDSSWTLVGLELGWGWGVM